MMRVVTQVITICCLFIFLSVSAQAAVYTYIFKPYPADIVDLDHYKYYDWVINWEVPNGQVITGADLIFYNIYNWQSDDNDKLYLHLIADIPSSGLPYSYDQQSYTTNGTASPYTTVLKYGTDNQAETDYWDLYPDIATWTDPDDNSSSTPKLTFAIPISLLSELKDGSFGIGMDPDCHYYNTGVKLKIYTTVPEPKTMLLIGSGLLSFLFFIHRRKQ